MPEEFDFSELRKYLQGQMDMGEEDLLLDEPWTLTRKKSAVPAGAPRPANPMPQMRPANPAPFPQPSQTTAPKNPAPFPSAAQSALLPHNLRLLRVRFRRQSSMPVSRSPRVPSRRQLPRTNSPIPSAPSTMLSRPTHFTRVPRTLFATKARNTRAF